LGAGGHQFESGRPDFFGHRPKKHSIARVENVTSPLETAKSHAAIAAADLVQSGMITGLGSGTTAALIVRRLGERIKREGLSIVAVATSVATAELAEQLGIPVRELDEVGELDINLDGADEIDPQFQMIKGLGGALLREKIVATAARHRVNVITADKRTLRLGTRAPIPVEVSPIGVRHTERLLQALGAITTIRIDQNGARYLTDGGNHIIDCRFKTIDDPGDLDRRLQCLPGVLDTGLFVDLCDTLIVGSATGVLSAETHVRDRVMPAKSPAAL
jgi:ribose 5-phosphate isomerase A